MKKLQIGIAIGAIALGIVGCVSVDGTRAQLSSKDVSEVKKGEETIYAIATTGRDSSGIVRFQTPQQVEYVQLTSNEDLLLRIIDNAHDGEVIATATERLDFSKKGAAHSFVKERFEHLHAGIRTKALKEKIVSKLTQEELLDLVWNQKTNQERYDLNSKDKDMVLNRLIAITDSPTILWRMREGDIHIEWGERKVVEQRLLSMLDKVTDEQMIEQILSARNQSGTCLVDKPEQRIHLINKLPESKIVTLALKNINDHSISAWNKGDLSALETGIGISASIKDTKSAAKIVDAIFAKIAKHRKECVESWTMTWGNEDEEQVKKLIAALPKLSDSVIAALVCLNTSSWKYLIDDVTEENAYNILVQGEEKSDELEVALVEKLSAPKVDMKVFASVKTDAGKKAVMAAMSADVKKAAQESIAKALAAVMDKAKEARLETFELHGFYLGMDWEDMKLVLFHHFPDYKITETRDGDGKNADYVVYITEQRAPFCYASANDKKVYQFNFGKKMLKKWYNYDVQTYSEWALAYGQETKIDMKFKFIEKDATVYADDMSRSYRVWFSQESYQYKHNTKGYRLTFFGDEKELTLHGGLEGAIIKERAARYFRYVRGDSGSLRVRVEKD